MLSPCLLLAAVLPAAAPPAPPPPAAYDVQIRYQINAFRNERIRQFFEMTGYFKDAGFVRDPDDVPPDDEAENPQYDRMRGTIPSDKARLLLGERHVRVIELLPRGVKPPEADAPVRVDLELAPDFAPERQRLLPNQVAAAIVDLKFHEAAAYDRRGGTRLLGSVPASALDTLLSDVRKRPGAPHIGPIQSAWPIRVVNVRPDLPVPSVRPELPAVPKGQEKLSPELRELVGDAAKAAAPTRMEVILSGTPTGDAADWIAPLKLAEPGLVVEGRLGPVLSVRAPANQATALAALPDVAAVRLPRVARPRLETAETVQGFDPLYAAGLVRLKDMKRQGRGTRVAVIDGDFSGWRGLVGKELPDDARMVDLTRERNHDLQPDPDPGDGKTLGHGVVMALAVLRAAPQVELVLVRIDSAAPYMLQEAARGMNGNAVVSDSLRNRRQQLDADRIVLDQQSSALLEERRLLLRNFPDVTQKDVLLKKKEKGVLTLDEEQVFNDILKYEDYEKRQADWNRRDRENRESVDRYFQLLKDLQNLKDIRVAASGLVWNEGHPADTTSALTRDFDEAPFGSAIWFQAAGDARGQAWSGLFRDDDNNGVMEFDSAPAVGAWSGDHAPTHDNHWARELNFLAWAPDAPPPNPPPASGEGRVGALDLPAGARARLSLQWREAHDPRAGRPGEDPYVKPLANLRIVLLSQPDPAGAKRPADDLDVVAQSVGLPERLEATPSSAVYEQTLELRVAKAGRYAVRIEGYAPVSTRPPEDPTVPGARKEFELHPRLFVETLDGAGRVLLHDFTTEAGSLGMPADSRAVVTVGAADSKGRPEPYSAGGPPHDVLLLPKPDVLAYDQMVEEGAQGTGVAAGFAAGVAAAVGGKAPPGAAVWREAMQVEPGGVVRVPK